MLALCKALITVATLVRPAPQRNALKGAKTLAWLVAEHPKASGW